MGFFSLKLSGTSIAMACGRLIPDSTRYSNRLSSEALSLIPGWRMGLMPEAGPRVGEVSALSRAAVHSRLPRTVLISPLCATRRKGCARLHVGKVLVEKRECTSASALVR